MQRAISASSDVNLRAPEFTHRFYSQAQLSQRASISYGLRVAAEARGLSVRFRRRDRDGRIRTGDLPIRTEPSALSRRQPLLTVVSASCI
jgi:hypothetical protein